MTARNPFAQPEELLRRVYAYAAYRVGDPTEAEDITSETFERALRYRHSYDPGKGSPTAWILGIARTCVYDAMLRPRPIAAETEEASWVDVEAEVMARLALADALAFLSDHDRELLALRYGADLPARDIARLLDLRTNAAEVALTRARARLAAALEHPDFEEREAGGGRLIAEVGSGAL